MTTAISDRFFAPWLASDRGEVLNAKKPREEEPVHPNNTARLHLAEATEKSMESDLLEATVALPTHVA